MTGNQKERNPATKPFEKKEGSATETQAEAAQFNKGLADDTGKGNIQMKNEDVNKNRQQGTQTSQQNKQGGQKNMTGRSDRQEEAPGKSSEFMDQDNNKGDRKTA